MHWSEKASKKCSKRRKYHAWKSFVIYIDQFWNVIMKENVCYWSTDVIFNPFN